MENMIRNNNLKIILEFLHCLFLGELSDRKTNFLDILFALKKLYTRPNLSIFTANQTRAVFMVVLFGSCYEKILLKLRRIIKGTEQLVHTCSLISPIVVFCLDRRSMQAEGRRRDKVHI